MAEQPSSQTLAAAVLRRSENSSATLSSTQEYEKRQEFRRLIDPGIFRPNSKETGLASLETLSTIAENLLREPDNPKFQQFKPTNDLIRRRLVEPKGALEYAIKLGFRPEVKGFQPYYVFNSRHVADLRIGAAILKEAIELETQKQERLRQSKAQEKAAAEAVARNVKLAFIDDRKTKALRDEMERARRAAKDAAASVETTEDSPPHTIMPGVGDVLSGSDPAVDPMEEE